MAVTFKKAPAKAVEPKEDIPHEFAGHIDALGTHIAELGKLQEKIQATFKKELARIAVLEKAIKADTKMLSEAMTTEYKDADPDETFVVKGSKFQLEIGKAGKTRTITDIQVAANELGDEEFWKLCKLNLGDLDKYLTPAQLELCVKTDRGDRKVEVAAKGL